MEARSVRTYGKKGKKFSERYENDELWNKVVVGNVRREQYELEKEKKPVGLSTRSNVAFNIKVDDRRESVKPRSYRKGGKQRFSESLDKENCNPSATHKSGVQEIRVFPYELSQSERDDLNLLATNCSERFSIFVSEKINSAIALDCIIAPSDSKPSLLLLELILRGVVVLTVKEFAANCKAESFSLKKYQHFMKRFPLIQLLHENLGVIPSSCVLNGASVFIEKQSPELLRAVQLCSGRRATKVGNADIIVDGSGRAEEWLIEFLLSGQKFDFDTSMSTIDEGVLDLSAVDSSESDLLKGDEPELEADNQGQEVCEPELEVLEIENKELGAIGGIDEEEAAVEISIQDVDLKNVDENRIVSKQESPPPAFDFEPNEEQSQSIDNDACGRAVALDREEQEIEAHILNPLTEQVESENVRLLKLRSSLDGSLEKAGNSSSKQCPREVALQEKKIMALIFSFLAKDVLEKCTICVSRMWSQFSVAACRELDTRKVKMLRVFVEERLRRDASLRKKDLVQSGLLSEVFSVQRLNEFKFLSEGCYKRVFRAYNSTLHRYEAVSVMDYVDVYNYGSLSVVTEEVCISLLLSGFVESNRCPNFVQTYKVEQSTTPPQSIAADCPGSNSKRAKDIRVYQYIRMEFCDLGDFEEHQKTIHDEVIDIEVARSAVFQMCFSLYFGWKEARLRHFDVKLLNFFLRTTSPREVQNFLFKVDESNQVFRLPQNCPFLVKLADFGTSDVREESIGEPVSLDHFTTIENLPPEFFILGDAALVDGVDAFALGLSILHILTGSRPYEEIMEQIVCPEALKSVLEKIWLKSKTFTKLRHVCSHDPTGTAYSTLYRYLVLFGVEAFESGFNSLKAGSAVMEGIIKVLGSKPTRSKLISAARVQYLEDRQQFHWREGKDRLFSRAQARMEIAGAGLVSLISSLLDVSPSTREKQMSTILSNDFFCPLLAE